MQKITMQNFNTECNEALKEISLSVSKGFSVEQTEQGCIVHTPFYDPDNDPVSVLLKEKDNKIILTDMGESMGYLFLHGLDCGSACAVHCFFGVLWDLYDPFSCPSVLLEFSLGIIEQNRTS